MQNKGMFVTLEVTCHKCDAAISACVRTEHYGFSSRIVTQELEIELSDNDWKTKHEPQERRKYTCPKCLEPPEMEIGITEAELKRTLYGAIKAHYAENWREEIIKAEVDSFFDIIMASDCSYERKED